jgi:hypothetical protein
MNILRDTAIRGTCVAACGPTQIIDVCNRLRFLTLRLFADHKLAKDIFHLSDRIKALLPTR